MHSKILSIIAVITVIIIGLSFAGCFLFEQEFHGNWTIMVWMAGDNNLEPQAMDDLNEMEYGLYLANNGDSKIAQKMAVVLQIDRISGYDSYAYGDKADWTGTRRYLLKPDKTFTTLTATSSFTSELLEELGEVNMGDARNLQEFIDFCKANYPSDYYALVLWNHGSGVRSIGDGTHPSRQLCFDDTSGGDALYTGELTDVLSDKQDVDLLGIDACLMGMVEVAYEYRPADGKHGLGFFFPQGDKYYELAGLTHYQLQWWYTNEDTVTWQSAYSSGKPYGKIDFCNSNLNGVVETWRELLEAWYDIDYEGDWTYYTPGHF